MQAFLKQDPNHPGLETVRLPNTSGDEPISLPAHCREIESEVCLVCRRCGRAYPQESTLLAHQRSCYLGNQQRRGALRLVQARYSCSLCDTGVSTRTYASLAEWRRHAETIQHRARLESQQRQFTNQQHFTGHDNDGQSGEEANPLTDEMEDVVNQITLLAARAAAESTTTTTTTTTTGQENNNGPEAKRQKLVQEVAALAGAR
uniref:C2H2-type domain-containing protein n=1 Tax=Bracon brevicornis TaxID=1563983 RepID=A0A6V7L0M6_9HYME